MSRLDEQFTEQFHRFELRGRGWRLFDEPVALEPPFVPFAGYHLPQTRRADDGRRHTRLSGFLDRLRGASPQAQEERTPEQESAPISATERELIELQLALPSCRPPSPSQIEAFVRQVCRPEEPLALEIVGTSREIVPQFVSPIATLRRLQSAILAAIPDAVCIPSASALVDEWSKAEPSVAVAELGLGAEFMVPLGDSRGELLSQVVSALDSLSEGELGLFQVIFAPAVAPWAKSIRNSVGDSNRGAFFTNRPELVRAAESKVSSPLFAVLLRLASCAGHLRRAWEIVADMAAALSTLSRPGSNYLVPLPSEGYPWTVREEDILLCRSRRAGMILNLEELAHLITLPTAATSHKLRRETAKSRPAPRATAACSPGAILLGDNRHAGLSREVWLSAEERVRHMHVIGASGTGKSTLLLNLIQQDIESGQGIAVFDPHGDLIERILERIPSQRIEDVVLVNPADEEYSVGFNVLAAHSEFEKALLASDLVAVFQRLSTSWGDQMNSVLRNAILAFLESSEGGTLADLRRFLLEPAYRTRFLATVQDPEIIYYWHKVFPQLSGGKSVGPVVTRLDEFLSRKPIRYMVSQKESRIDFAEVLDRGRIFLAKLSQGEIGKENSYLLGSFLLSKIQQTAMSRQRLREAERRDFWCYVDEFHSFISPSMAEILTGARKYRVGLALAHQELRQVQANPEVAGAVLSNPFTRLVFRVGDADARALCGGFSHFEAGDLQNLETGDAIGRIEKSDSDFNLTVRPPSQPSTNGYIRRDEVIAASRRKYARTRSEIESELFRHRQAEEAKASEARKANPKAESPLKPATNAASSDADFSPIRQAPSVEREPPPDAARPEVLALPHESLGATISSPIKQPVSIAPIVPEVEAVPLPPRDLGRGGAQHLAIQGRIKEAAEALGFRATLEKEILQGRGSVDVYLERGSHVIACEISVTTTIDHEVGNVSKCFKAKLPAIAVVATDEERLGKIKAAVANSLGGEAASRTTYFLPDQFVEHLRSLPDANSASGANEETRRGYKVKRNIVALSDEERAGREQEALMLISERLRHSPGS